MLNIPALEAYDDLRQARLVGAIFGGEDGKEYIEQLIEIAWWHEPDQADSEKQALAIASAKHKPLSAPPEVYNVKKED